MGVSRTAPVVRAVIDDYLKRTGRVQRWGDPVEEIQQGDVVWIPPGQKHWHGAASNSSMAHIAIVGQLDGKSVEWMEKVSDSQYGAPPQAASTKPRPSQGPIGDFAPKVAELTRQDRFTPPMQDAYSFLVSPQGGLTNYRASPQLMTLLPAGAKLAELSANSENSFLHFGGLWTGTQRNFPLKKSCKN